MGIDGGTSKHCLRGVYRRLPEEEGMAIVFFSMRVASDERPRPQPITIEAPMRLAGAKAKLARWHGEGGGMRGAR